MTVKVKQEQFHGGSRASRGKSAGHIRCLRILLQAMHNKKMFELESEGQGLEFNIRNGSIRWQISISIKVINEQFSIVFNDFEILTFQNSWNENFFKNMIYNICSP